MYDVTSRASFDIIELLFNEVLKAKSWDTPNTIALTRTICPILIMGNKSDKEAYRGVLPKEGRHLAERLGYMFIDTLAKNNKYVLESISRVVEVTVGLESIWTLFLDIDSRHGCCTLM